MSSLKLRDFSVFYGDFQAVKQVNLEIPKGQIVALLGGSGSGKSSLLRAVAGLETAVGQLSLDGQDLHPIPVYRRQFGLMFQDGQLFGHRTVAGNIEFGLASLSRAEKQARTQELLRLVGLAGFENRRISTLSGGQQQRVALARALAPHPRLLLLDEPLSALDRSLREQLAVEIRRVVKEQGLTAVYVTHDQQEALAVADRVLVMQDGRILRDATPLELWRDPRFVEVAEFLGFELILPLKVAALAGINFPKGAAQPVDAGAEPYVAFAPGAFQIAERNSPTLTEVTNETLVSADVLDVRVGRGVADLALSLPGALGKTGKPVVFNVSAPLSVLGQGSWPELFASKQLGDIPSRRVTLRVDLESVCLVTETPTH